MPFHSKGHAFYFVREVVLNCFSSVPSVQLMTQAPKTSISRCGSTKFPGHEKKLVIFSQKNFNSYFFPITFNEPAFKTELISLVANEKECSMVSCFSGPLTAAIILFPFLLFGEGLKKRMMKLLLLDIFAPSLILTLTHSLRS